MEREEIDKPAVSLEEWARAYLDTDDPNLLRVLSPIHREQVLRRVKQLKAEKSRVTYAGPTEDYTPKK